ncbi:MAG: NADH-quinone oxidoreductase subunit C [Planctomycetota bacterium]|nr:NADH-quinone oxidoreductase subunit C [Planctomycetota bacterium]
MAEPSDSPVAAAADPVTAKALEALQAALPDAVVDSVLTGQHPWIQVRAQDLRATCRLLRDDPALRYDCCHLISAVDFPAPTEGEPHIDVVYHLVSYVVRPEASYAKRAEKNDPFLAIKVSLPREKPEVPTVLDIWIGADWHERETWDLMGVRFTGRAELPRILLPEDWPGHPLRKDWEFPASYHGVPIIPPEGL